MRSALASRAHGERDRAETAAKDLLEQAALRGRTNAMVELARHLEREGGGNQLEVAYGWALLAQEKGTKEADATLVRLRLELAQEGRPAPTAVPNELRQRIKEAAGKRLYLPPQ